MEITGKIVKVSDVKFYENNFMVREFYLDCSEFNRNTGEKIDNFIKFQLTGSYVDIIDAYPIGSLVVVTFNIRGRIYEKDGKKGHIQSLNAWKIQYKQIQRVPSNQQPNHQSLEQNKDDLPY